MHRTSISEDDRSAGSVGGANAPVASLPKPPLGTVILVYRGAEPPPRIGSVSESMPDIPPSIGMLSARLVARWSLPRMKMLARDQEG